MAFEQVFKQIDNKLRLDAGCATAMDYVEQSSWILFLKYLDDLDQIRSQSALLTGETFTPIIDQKYCWSSWAMPKNAKGEYDIQNALVGDDLIEFVNLKLFPYLAKFFETAQDGTVEKKIGVIFKEVKNKIVSGYNLREVIELVDTLRFQTSEEKHEMTALYENRLSQMGNAGRNGGEYYTPRPLIRTIVKVIDPKIGETFYDGACGSAGFLCEGYNYMHQKVKSTDEERILQTNTFYGQEYKGLPYLIAIMNMILHGVEAPNIVKTDTLNENLSNIQPKDQVDKIGANPPFGGTIRSEILQNFPIKSGETAYLFLQHFIKKLKAGGEAGIVIKNTFLSNGDAASLRKKLIEDCNLYAVLDLPAKVFQAGVKTVVLFFKKGTPTQKIWYYQLNLDRTLGKTNPLNEKDLAEFLELQKNPKETENSWFLDVNSLDENYDLSAKNPNKVEVVDERTPEEIMTVIEDLAKERTSLFNELKGLV